MAILVDPARIAVGGGLMSQPEQVLAALERRLSASAPFAPELVPAQFINDGPLRGAIALALDAKASIHPSERSSMSSRSTQSTVAALAIAMVVAMGLAACGGDDDNGSADKASGDGGGGGKTIALLLPETKTTRYEEKDRPLFTAKVKELCPDCEIIYANASQDPNKQQQQAEAAITNGADVLVLDAVDVKSVGPIVQHANQEDIPVIAYDRLIPDQDIAYYVSFDNVKQGRIQAQTLLDKLGSGADGEVDRDGERRSHRSERGRLQEGRPPGVRQERSQDRQGVRHS